MKFPGMIRPPLPVRLFSGKNLVCSMPPGDGDIYLTFDDGPIPEMTPGILEILDGYQVKATFFMVGDNVRKYPGVFEKVRDAGHAVGNHTFHHLNGWRTPPAAYVEDVNRCDGLLRTPLFRPPYGRLTPSQFFLLKKRYKIILWSLLTTDYSRKTTPEQCLEIAKKYTRPGSIVVFHDSIKAREKVLYALPRYLDFLLQHNYKLQTL
jgi:peptidoglycan/xylan/chitin deacetylase (PgdA/CDA1 family)